MNEGEVIHIETKDSKLEELKSEGPDTYGNETTKLLVLDSSIFDPVILTFLGIIIERELSGNKRREKNLTLLIS